MPRRLRNRAAKLALLESGDIVHLKADAVAGPVSLMVLNRATGVAEPALRTAQP